MWKVIAYNNDKDIRVKTFGDFALMQWYITNHLMSYKNIKIINLEKVKKNGRM